MRAFLTRSADGVHKGPGLELTDKRSSYVVSAWASGGYSTRENCPAIRGLGLASPAHLFESLDPSSIQRLRNVEIAFRINGNTVRAGDAPQLVTARPAELRQFLARNSIEDSNQLVAEIADIHVPLGGVTRQGERPGCAVARIGRPEENRNREYFA